MKHHYQVVRTKTIEITVRQFVTKYLKSIQLWKATNGEDEYDFYVDGQDQNGILTRKFSLPCNLFRMDLRSWAYEPDRTKEMVNHVICVLEENYNDEW